MLSLTVGFQMPSSDAILSGLTAIANDWATVAIAWHVLLGSLVLALICGWRPSTRVAGYLLAAPLLSVSGAAWASRNLFNGAGFAALVLLLLGIASRLSKAPVHLAPAMRLVPGAFLFSFGWGYPHLLETEHWTTFAYAAPLGLLPCPTLSAAIGLTLILGLSASLAWSLTLAAAGLVYGAIGVFVLGVELDYILLAGALIVLGTLRTLTDRSECGLFG